MFNRSMNPVMLATDSIAYDGLSFYPDLQFTTCAVDVKNCERVFGCVRDAVLQKNMDLSGV